MLGREVLEYDPAHMLVLAVDLPVSGQVTRASHKDPYLGFKLDLVPARVAELAARVYPSGVPKPSDNRGLYVGQRDRRHHRRRERLLDLMADGRCGASWAARDRRDSDASDEDPSARVAQMGHRESGVQRIGEAATWIRAHFAQPVTVEEMAASVHMGASSFHQRFKAVTSMSPLQFRRCCGCTRPGA